MYLFCYHTQVLIAISATNVASHKLMMFFFTMFQFWFLNHGGRVTRICINKLGQIVACSLSNHYVNRFWFIVNRTQRNELKWNLNNNTTIFYQWNAFEKVVWKMVVILFQSNLSTWKLQQWTMLRYEIRWGILLSVSQGQARWAHKIPLLSGIIQEE